MRKANFISSCTPLPIGKVGEDLTNSGNCGENALKLVTVFCFTEK